jgi:multiple sugar transport system ATP-binding protein
VFKDHPLITVTDPHTPLHSGDIVKIRPQNQYYFDASGARLT